MASCQTASPDVEVSRDVLRKLLVLARDNLYEPFEHLEEDEEVLLLCQKLFTKDYECHLMKNFGVELKTHYPKCLIVPLKDKNNPEVPSLSGRLLEDSDETLKSSFLTTKYVRQCRRIIVPTILLNGKYICRSAAIYENVAHACTEDKVKATFEKDNFEYEMNIDTAIFIFLNLDLVIKTEEEIHLMQKLEINYICDLRLRSYCPSLPIYSDFVNSSREYLTNIYKNVATSVHLPYPSLDFFQLYTPDAKLEDLRYGFKRNRGYYNLEVPDVQHRQLFDKDIETFNTWNLKDRTENYLLTLLTYISSGNGILLHSILGQDRTPVFLTLLRLSLWADGLIHQSLSPIEVLYLSVAYDWYLFGHDLPLCLKNKFQIMHFCFNYLEEISGSKFSMRNSDEETLEESASSSAPVETKREKKLKAVRKLFLDVYFFQQI